MSWSHEQKKKLAARVQKLKKKRQMVRVLEMVVADSAVDLEQCTENHNGVFMFFQSLHDATYEKIDEYLTDVESKVADLSSEQPDYSNYRDEFPSEHRMSPKLRYSNREKTLMKRRRYNQEETDETYCQFDVSMLTEEESSEAPSPSQPSGDIKN